MRQQARIDAVEHRLVDSDLRAATATAALTAATRDLYTLLRDRFELRDRVERCERDIHDLKHGAG